jgi:hypothetical protein
MISFSFLSLFSEGYAIVSFSDKNISKFGCILKSSLHFKLVILMYASFFSVESDTQKTEILLFLFSKNHFISGSSG